MPLRRVLPAFEEAQPGIQVQVPGGMVGQRRGIELKLENFPACSAPGMQPPQPQRLCEADPVCIDGDRRGHGLNAASSSATPRAQSSQQVHRHWQSRSS